MLAESFFIPVRDSSIVVAEDDPSSPITDLARFFILSLADESAKVFIASYIFPVGADSLYKLSISTVIASELSFLSL